MNRRVLTPRNTNFVPGAYREVSVQSYGGPMTEAGVTEHLVGKEAYRTTRFIVLERASECALVEVTKRDTASLFSPIERVDAVVLPDRCRFVDAPELDTGNATALAERAASLAPGTVDALIVRGQDGHVNFIYRSEPLRVRVFDVVPPQPSKLARVAEQVLAFAELPATRIDTTLIDLRDLAARAGETEAFLVPCRASGLEFDRPTRFLDERPERRDWTLLGCERSRQIHRHFYGETPPCIDTCPRNLLADDATPTLLRCCLLEDTPELEGHRAVVPWGATRRAVESALRHLTGGLRESSAADKE